MDQMTSRAPASIRGVPEDIAQKIREMGTVFNGEVLVATRKLYLPLLKALPRTGFTIEKDISYGPHERHLLDIHLPDPKPVGVPVVLFFHGGGFTEGHKNTVGEYIYGNVADYFAREGMIGINATYRLADIAKYPGGAEDVGLVVAWVKKNIAQYGGDPSKIFVIGHSAGASHVSHYALRKEIFPAGGPGIAGAILMSGGYMLNAKQPAPNALAYYGEDTSSWAGKSLIGNVTWDGSFDIFLSTAEYEPFQFNRSLAALVDELTAKGGRMPRVKYLLGHNHPSQTMAFGTDDPTIGPEVLDFILTSLAKKKS